MPKNGGSATALYMADPNTYPVDIGLDDQYVYFGVNGAKGGMLLVAPKK